MVFEISYHTSWLLQRQTFRWKIVEYSKRYTSFFSVWIGKVKIKINAAGGLRTTANKWVLRAVKYSLLPPADVFFDQVSSIPKCGAKSFAFPPKSYHQVYGLAFDVIGWNVSLTNPRVRFDVQRNKDPNTRLRFEIVSMTLQNFTACQSPVFTRQNKLWI